MEQMPREVLKSPFLEMLQTWLAKVQWNLFQANPVLIWELERMIPRDPSQPVSFHNSTKLSYSKTETSNLIALLKF